MNITKDGNYDCLASGRKSTFLAFEPKTGKVFWDASYTSIFNDNWNIYNPLILPYDVDNDNVNDVVISTGGNPAIPSENHEREAGLIMMFSGKTGQMIGKELKLPDEKETYMSPVLHVQKDKSAYLLIGNGGETVNGFLYIIGLPNFYKHIMNDTSASHISFKGNFSSKILESFERDENITSLYKLFKTDSKGVMVIESC
jgi:hypothetical protein